jgi:hypothetical protein
MLHGSTGIKVSFRVGPGEDEVQIILLSDRSFDPVKSKIGEVSSVVRNWKAHESLRAAALLIMAEEDFHRRPRRRRARNSRSLGLKIEIIPVGGETSIHMSLRDDSNQIASRDLSVSEMEDLIDVLPKAAKDVRGQRETYDSDDD